MQEKPTIPEVFLKPYNSAESEPRIRELWEKSGYANPDVCVKKGVAAPDAEPFSIVLPPPNVTGTLHMGHAAMLAIEDILIRYARMRGKRTLWLPGTDSAAIATQSKVEEILYKTEKKTRHDIGREELLRRVNAFAEESKTTIINQVKALGASLDWSRYAYTLDEKRYTAVMTAFVRMYEAGLIYRGNRIVNWDPKLQTTVSDDEIEYVEQTDPFYYLQYGPFTIATVRPETKFGDKYVVMHPDDERYKTYTHGQTLELEWINGPVVATVIKDEGIDMSFGSGAMTITPAHDAHDFELAQKHGLEAERVIDDRGILLAIAGEFKGQHIKKARAAIVEKLRKKGLIVKVDEKYVHNVATNGRGGGVIEPQIKLQWFIAVGKTVHFPDGKERTLKEWMREAVETGAVKIAPERFERIYYHWIDNLRDWCISRQIWFGHRIPVWYRKDNEGKVVETIVSVAGPSSAKASEGTWEQDPDTLDTWFSSGLWTFSTLGWPFDYAEGKPKPGSDLATYHPTAVLETGYDIIFFWVARMILMSGFHLGTVPFRRVYLHGLVRDAQGRKMSKSLGNIIDPLVMVEKYGADATRLSLIIGAAPGMDLKLSEDRVRGYKHFANKLWNITRFVLENTEGETLDKGFSERNEHDADLRAERQTLLESVTKNIDEWRLDLAADTLYHYVWDRFAAEIIEDSKRVFKEGSEEEKACRRQFLLHTLDTILRALHPFMPLVTETIWQELPHKDADLLMISRWPV
jgi:valyl-tRNA synthetase